MSTALETVVGTLFFDLNGTFPNSPLTQTVYTVPAGKYARVYPQEVRVGDGNSTKYNVAIGKVLYFSRSGQNTTDVYRPTNELNAPADLGNGSSAIYAISSRPIVLNEGQTILIGGAVSGITCFIEEFNKVT